MARARSTPRATSSGTCPGSDPDGGHAAARLAPRHGARRRRVRRAARRARRDRVRRAAARRGRDAAVRASTCSASPTRRGCASAPRTSAAARSPGRSTTRCSRCADADGVTRARGARRRPARAAASRRGERLLGYCEVHIEQGPVLEAARRAGRRGRGDRRRDARRGDVHRPRRPRRDGADGAAGTTPRARWPSSCSRSRRPAAPSAGLRRDGRAARGARRARRTSSRARRSASLDVRHADDAVRAGAVAAAARAGARRSPRRAASRSTWEDRLDDARGGDGPGADRRAGRGGRRPPALPDVRLPSGAGHDAVALARADRRRDAVRALRRRRQPPPGRVGRGRRRRRSRSTSSTGFVRGAGAMTADLVHPRRRRRGRRGRAGHRGRRTAGSPRSGRSCRARARGDRRARAARAARRASTRTCTSTTRAARDWEGFATGTARARRRRHDVRDRHAAQRDPADGRRRGVRRQGAAAARGAAHVDVALWGGLVPGDLDRLDELAARGVVGFKAFMSASGVEEFPAADDLTLLRGDGAAPRGSGCPSPCTPRATR